MNQKYEDHEYECCVWFERDRANVSLHTPKGRVVFDLWDEDVFEAIEGGFLTTPRLFGFSNRFANDEAAWQQHAVAYARNQGLIR